MADLLALITMGVYCTASIDLVPAQTTESSAYIIQRNLNQHILWIWIKLMADILYICIIDLCLFT